MAAAVALSFALTGCNKAHKDVSALLRDPPSARFTQEVRGPKGGKCGLVQGKNAMGGYADPSPYIFSSNGHAYIYDDNLSRSSVTRLVSMIKDGEHDAAMTLIANMNGDCDFYDLAKSECPKDWLPVSDDNQTLCHDIKHDPSALVSLAGY